VVKTRVVVLFGGQSSEHDVSLRSARTVIGALDPERYDVRQVGIARDGRWLTSGDPMRALASDSPFFSVAAESSGAGDGAAPVSPESAMSALAGDAVDVVFPVLHGPMGEDGTVQGLLELAGIPYVGSGVLGSAVAMDKAMAKHVLTQADIAQAPWRLVPRREWAEEPDTIAAAIAEHPRYPCFVKPANMGSSVGVSKVHGPEELADAMDLPCIMIVGSSSRRTSRGASWRSPSSATTTRSPRSRARSGPPASSTTTRRSTSTTAPS
jgi:D-alanine-D-alanine ligase